MALRFGIVLVVVTLLTYVCYEALGQPRIGIDDANITLVYGKHLQQEHELTYNVGGERVEGFSSLAWVLVAALFYILTNRPEAPLLILNLLLVSGALTIMTLRIDRWLASPTEDLPGRHPRFSLASVVFLVWVFANPAYVCWATLPLMETGLWSVLLLGATALFLFPRRESGPRQSDTTKLAVVVPLLITTRPEGLLFAAAFVALLFLGTLVRTQSVRLTWRQMALPCLTLIVTSLALTLFRLLYFGYPLPNTYYAKIGDQIIPALAGGWNYLRAFVADNPVVLLSIVFSGWALLEGTRGLLLKRLCEWTDHTRQLLTGVCLMGVVLLGLAIPVAGQAHS